MASIKKILNSPYFFWAVLAFPGVLMAEAWFFGGARYGATMHESGEFSARLMIVALMITPLRLVFAQSRWPLWLLRRRRYLGVAAFGYAVLHLVAYLMHTASLPKILGELLEVGIWTGWIAFLAFVPLALTSNDRAVRRLGRRWKKLQRLAYAAALFTAAHWVFIEYHLGPALLHFAPLLALEGFRIWKQQVVLRPQRA